ncbi:hypothetical protein EYC80_007670 [Monilinia laxa]|uniref:Uncharacterized protein n=1 Tax=Monilinia laxa TaxID=61186 RepID=A0A5N6JWN6_MONLA|nr:hypothetical protein EYC80_007670 [Monilinia laxa]
MSNSKSPSINPSPPVSSSQNKNEDENENQVDNGWVTMTEISISRNGDIECSSPLKGLILQESLSKDPTPASPLRKERILPANNVTYMSSTVNFEALPEASSEALRHVELEGMIHHQGGAGEGLCLMMKSGYGNGHDVHESSYMDMDMDLDNDDDEDEAGNETESSYTFAPVITLNEMSPNSNLHPPHRCQPPISSIPRTPHHPTPLELNQLFPRLPGTPPTITKTTHHQGHPPPILHPAKILTPQSKTSRKSRKHKQKTKQRQRQQQNSTVQDGGSKTTNIPSDTDIDMQQSPQPTNSTYTESE